MTLKKGLSKVSRETPMTAFDSEAGWEFASLGLLQEANKNDETRMTAEALRDAHGAMGAKSE